MLIKEKKNKKQPKLNRSKENRVFSPLFIVG